MSITIPTRGVVDVTVRTRNKTMVSNGANAITPPGSFRHYSVYYDMVWD